MAKNAAKLRGAKRRLEELSTNFDVRKLAARIEEGDNKEDYYILCGWMGEEDVKNSWRNRRTMIRYSLL